jgi:hypothetical protein
MVSDPKAPLGEVIEFANGLLFPQVFSDPLGNIIEHEVVGAGNCPESGAVLGVREIHAASFWSEARMALPISSGI